jgi:hypothetical protein
MRTFGLSHSAGEKLARFLLEWAANYPGEKGQVRIKLTLTPEEIAQMIGSSRETVTRLLADFQKAARAGDGLDAGDQQQVGAGKHRQRLKFADRRSRHSQSQSTNSSASEIEPPRLACQFYSAIIARHFQVADAIGGRIPLVP